jgi:hypothetical protein
MVTGALLVVYLVFPVLTLFSMVVGRTFSLRRFRGLWRSPRRITREDWLAVYASIGGALESGGSPPEQKPERRRRPVVAGGLFLASVFLFFVPLPMDVSVRFAQYRWDVFPVIQAALGGMALAFSLGLAFHDRRRYVLDDPARAEYPYIDWAMLSTPGATEAKR